MPADVVFLSQLGLPRMLRGAQLSVWRPPCRHFLCWLWSHRHTDVWIALRKERWNTLLNPNPVCGTYSRAVLCTIPWATEFAVFVRYDACAFPVDRGRWLVGLALCSATLASPVLAGS